MPKVKRYKFFWKLGEVFPHLLLNTEAVPISSKKAVTHFSARRDYCKIHSTKELVVDDVRLRESSSQKKVAAPDYNSEFLHRALLFCYPQFSNLTNPDSYLADFDAL